MYYQNNSETFNSYLELISSLGFHISHDNNEYHNAKQFYLELKVQRTIPVGTELTIRYNSVFEVCMSTD